MNVIPVLSALNSTEEQLDALLAENLRRCVAGEMLLNLVDKEREY